MAPPQGVLGARRHRRVSSGATSGCPQGQAPPQGSSGPGATLSRATPRRRYGTDPIDSWYGKPDYTTHTKSVAAVTTQAAQRLLRQEPKPQPAVRANFGKVDFVAASQIAESTGSGRQLQQQKYHARAPFGVEAEGSTSYTTSAQAGPGAWDGGSSMASRIAHRRLLARSPREPEQSAMVVRDI